ncbi:MAG: ABC transporter permease [Myxococcota bacterium]
MNLFETIRVALRAILRNKTRSFLTTLGVVIGVAAVIAMVAIGEGAKAEVEKSFASMGSNLLVIMSGAHRAGGASGGSGSQLTLTWEDLEAIRTEVPSVRLAAAGLRGNAQIVSDEQNWSSQVTGTSPEFFDIRSWPTTEGALFTAVDVEAASKVVVLGQTVAARLFSVGSDPVGQMVRIDNVPFQVVGVLAKKGQSPMGQDYDDAAFVPESTFQRRIRGGLQKFIAGQVHVAATSQAGTTKAEAELRALLRDRHRLAPTAEDDFSIRNLAELASAREESTRTLTTLLASIAFVSLLVGGIGIMNIMLVSVTERTREIGLRMAVGARPRDILAQFLVEAFTLSLGGGAIGIVLGLWAAEWLSAKFQWPMQVSPDIVLLAVGFSAAVGVVFGLYPARKASKLDPIDALRYE